MKSNSLTKSDILLYNICKKMYDGEKERFGLDESESKIMKKLMKENCFKSYLDSKYKEILEKTKQFELAISYYENKDREELFKLLNSYIGNINFDIEHPLALIFALYKKEDLMPQDVYSSLFFNIILNYDDLYLKLDKNMSLINECYYSIPVNYIFNDKTLIELLLVNGIYNIRDLKDLSINSLIVLLSKDINHYISTLSNLDQDLIENFKNKITSLLNELDDREKIIISLRNGFKDNKIYTLEETGKIYGLTRERVRQIENNAMGKINECCKLSNIDLASIYFSVANIEDKFITKDKLNGFIEDETICNYLCLLLSKNNYTIMYNEELEVMYCKNIITLEEIHGLLFKELGYYVPLQKFDVLDNGKKNFIKMNYRIVYNQIYLQNGILKGQLITDIIDDLFPSGYRISDDESFKLIEEEYLKRYWCLDENLNQRMIVGILERENYCLVDKGIYKNREYTTKLDDELYEKILNYILEHKPTIFYESIYEHFIVELNQIGINNYFYLKGVIDVKLPKEFNTKRNYIQIGSNQLSSKEAIIKYMNSFNGIFTFEELKTRFEGIKDYVIFNVIYSQNNNGLIMLSNNKFIYFENINLSNLTIKILDNFLDMQFKTINTRVISSKKVFARMMLTNKGLLNDLKVINDQFSLFSLLKYLFKDKYYFRRPLISLDESGNLNQESVVIEYVSKLDKFDIEIIKRYQDKLSLRVLYSYLEFMENMSEDYVQVELDTMVRKKLIGASEDFINEFRKTINLLLNAYECIDTRKFKGYVVFPNLKYRWNKYLLAGVVRTFFAGEFLVENTNSTYDVTDFIIRKI